MNNYYQDFRKLSLGLVCLLLSGFCCLAAQGQNQKPKKGFMPVELDLLFSALPQKLEGWKLTKSKGWRGHYKWLEAIVTREFEEVVEKEDKDSQPKKVRLSIKDTCKYPESDIRMFTNFKPDKKESVEYLYIDSVPAIVVEREEKLTARFLLKERFLLNITLYRASKKELGEWYTKLQIKTLTSVSDGPVVTLSNSVVDQSVDQLKDQNKSTVINLSEEDPPDEEEDPSGRK